MAESRIRLYADTSVVGGAFDEKFEESTLRLLDDIRRGRLALVTSVLVRNEIAEALERVRALFSELATYAEVAELTPEVLSLRDAYLHAGIVSEKWATDALHVAVATAVRCAVLVSSTSCISRRFHCTMQLVASMATVRSRYVRLRR